MDDFMKVQEDPGPNRGMPPAGKRTGGKFQNVWRWRSWGGEVDAAQSIKPAGPSKPPHSRAASAGSDMELSAWTGSTPARSHHGSTTSDGAGEGLRPNLGSPLPHLPATTSRRVSTSSTAPTVDVDDANSLQTQAGSVAHSFSSLHSMLQELDGPSSTAAAAGATDPSSGGAGQYPHPNKATNPASPLSTPGSRPAVSSGGAAPKQPAPAARSKASSSDDGSSSGAEVAAQPAGGLTLAGLQLSEPQAAPVASVPLGSGQPCGDSVCAEVGSQHSISSLLSSMSDWDRRSTGGTGHKEELPTGSTPSTSGMQQVDQDPLASPSPAAAPVAPLPVSAGQTAVASSTSSPAAVASGDPLTGGEDDSSVPAEVPSRAGSSNRKGPLQGAVKGVVGIMGGLGQRLQRSNNSSNDNINKAAGSQQELISRKAE